MDQLGKNAKDQMIKKHITQYSTLAYSLMSLLIIFAGVACFYFGRNSTVQTGHSPSPKNTVPISSQALNITIQVNVEEFCAFTSEETGGNFPYGAQYRKTNDVTIDLNGVSMKLEDALHDNLITEEDLFYYARKDARNGFCVQTVESNHGVSHFTFAYPDFNLRLIYDVFEAPDGEQHLISDMGIYIPYIDHIGYILEAYTDFRDPETGAYLDREDWGLEFEVTEASSTGISLKCTQSGGQQIGALFIDGYDLGNELFTVERLDGKPYIGEYTLDIQMEGSTEASIDWADVYGELPGGEYQLILHIFDKFTDSQVHPMMDDFHDWQVYTVNFTIS